MNARTQSVVLSDYTTLQVGGGAELMSVRSLEELAAAREIALQFPAPPLVIGGGSNLLAADTGYAGLIIKNDIRGCDDTKQGDTVYLTCGAGEEFDAVVAQTCDAGYWGLENLSAIPGSVGATPIQNVGAYGVEVSELIDSVTAMHLGTGEVRAFTPAECQFAYRDSFFKTPAGRAWCITSVTYRLRTVPEPRLSYGDLQSLKERTPVTPAVLRRHVMQIRAGKFPDWRIVGTAGSFFKNPIITNHQYEVLLQQYPALPGYPVDADTTKVSLGWILDHVCGLRGWCDGPVCLYEKQALVLIQTSDATASGIDSFASQVAAIVHKKTGITIEREVQSVG